MSAVERPSRIAARNKIALSRLERKALKSIRILEKVESVGVDNLMMAPPATVSPLALHSTSVYSGHVRRSDSPMTQLHSLKRMGGGGSGANDDVVIHKDTIKAVLSKGLSHDQISATIPEATEPDEASSKVAVSTEIKGPTETSAVIADTCVRRMQRQKSRRHMHASGLRRADLGTVNRPSSSSTLSDLGTNGLSDAASKESSFAQGFVGTISSLIFGRKGGFT